MLGRLVRILLWATVFCGCLAFASWLGTFTGSYQACQTHNHSAQSQPKPKKSDEWVFFECEGNFIDSNNGTLTALATIAIAVFTIVLARVSRLQAQVTREAMVAGERAFIFATGIAPYFDPPADPERPIYSWRYRPVWQNSGDTPTKNMTMYTECVLRDTFLPPGFNFAMPVTQIGNALIPPKVTTQGGLAPRMPAPPITPADILEIQAGRKFLYVWGWAKYWDVFPNTPQHITRFCFQLVPNGNPEAFVPGQNPAAHGSLSFGIVHHAEGNCADDECG